MPPSDHDLLNRFARERDRQALGMLFERPAAFAFRTAYAVLKDAGVAEDAVQEAFLKLIKAAGSVDPSRPFLPWLKTLVARTALNLARSGRRREARETLAATPKPSEDPAMQVIDREARERLKAEVQRLPEDLRRPVVLHYHAGCSYEETAEVLGCPAGTVATRLAAARERLKGALATAGIALAATTSLDEALAAGAPPPPVPATLGPALRALADSGAPGGSALGGLPWKAAAAVLLVVAAGVGLALRTEPSPPAPSTPPDKILVPAKTEPALPPKPAPPVEAPPQSPVMEAALPAGLPDAAPAPQGTASISGRVTELETGKPMPCALICHVGLPAGGDALAFPVGPTAWCHSTVSDDEGRFTFTGARTGGSYRLHVRSQHSDAVKLSAVFPPLQPGETRVHDLQVPRAWGLRLRLLHPDGTPVLLRQPGDPYASAIVTLKVGGRALFVRRLHDEALNHPEGIPIAPLDPERLPPAGTTVAIQAPGFLKAEVSGLDRLPVEDGLIRVEIRLDPGRVVSGRIIGPAGTAPTDERIFWQICCWPAGLPFKEGWTMGGMQRADALPDGTFRLQGLPPGEPLRLWAMGSWKPGQAPHDAADDPRAVMDAPLEIPPGNAEAVVYPSLDAHGTVSGRVLDERGEPMAGARVDAYFGDLLETGFQRASLTDAAGAFALTGLPHWPGRGAGGLQIVCDRVGWFGVPVGTRNLEIRLVPNRPALRPYAQAER